jgi:hypothetical protein
MSTDPMFRRPSFRFYLEPALAALLVKAEYVHFGHLSDGRQSRLVF